MKKVIVIGGGFAGLACLRVLLNYRSRFDITLIDKGTYQHFLPMLPDAIGRGVNPYNLTYDLEKFSNKRRVTLITDTVAAVNLDKKEVSTLHQTLSYDYVLISCGSETNFYGNAQIEKYAFKLDDASDAAKIHEAVARDVYQTYVISGGGYTGIEVATNIMRYLRTHSLNKRVVIIERAPAILGPLPQWMKEYVTANLQELGIEVLTGTAIEKVEDMRIQLQGGMVLENALLIWAAGVKIPDFVQKLNVEKNPQGRIKVDQYLRLNESCFVAGDAACVAQGNSFLRMAVQFAIMQGESAAKNIVRSTKCAPLKQYKPIDFGYIIPMANNLSCGMIMGMNLKGRLPTLMHYAMCVFRSYTLRNKIGIIKNLAGRGG